MTKIWKWWMFAASRGEVPGFNHDKALEVARVCGLFCLGGGGVNRSGAAGTMVRNAMVMGFWVGGMKRNAEVGRTLRIFAEKGMAEELGMMMGETPLLLDFRGEGYG